MSKYAVIYKIKYYLKRIYRISLSFEKQEKLVWNDLKKFHAGTDWKSGVFEKEKYVETVFRLDEKRSGIFYYMIYDGRYHCRVKVLENYPEELTTDIFILAAHLNNVLNNGVVVVNVNSQYVEYYQKRDLVIPLLYTDDIYDQLIRHFNISKDIYFAFERLVTEQEAPAIIIADLLKKNDDRVEKTEE
jgi:hypothetical protein